MTDHPSAPAGKKAARDQGGRFKKGTTGNPNGRPRKPEVYYSMAETSVLARTLAGKGKDGRMITVEEMNNMKLVEAAQRGDVRAQIHLDRKFERWREQKAKLQRQILDAESQYFVSGEYGPEELPPHIRYWMVGAYAALGERPIWERGLTPDDIEMIEKSRAEGKKPDREWLKQNPGKKLEDQD